MDIVFRLLRPWICSTHYYPAKIRVVQRIQMLGVITGESMKVRLYLALGVFLLGLVLAGPSLLNGQPLIALSLVLAGTYCGFGVLLGVGETIPNPMFHAAAAVIGAIGLFGVFLYHRAFDIGLQDAHRAAFISFVDLEAHSYCKPMTVELQRISVLGLEACATQDNVDQMSATAELAKGIYFGPTLSLADATYSSTTDPPKDYCAHAFKAAFAACPEAFHSLSGANKAALLKVLARN